MRVLTLCYEYPPIGGGGGRVAQAISEGLAARGHAVRVQTAALGFRSHREELAGVEVFRTASGRRRPDTCTVREMGQYVASSFPRALWHCGRWHPHVLHAHFALPTGLLAWALHRLTGIPYVLTAHLGDVPGGLPAQTDELFRRIGPFARLIWHEATAATAVSSFVQELAQQAYGRKVRIIFNGIALADRAPLASLRIGQPPELLFVGRFNPQKNAPLLLRALSLLAGWPWRLTMIGDGPDMAEVLALRQEYGLETRVRLLGWRTAEEVAAAMGEADILCLPSSSEGMPVAAIEALKHGLAIAASDIPGVRDVVTWGENGITAAAGDRDDLARALRQLVADPARLLALRQASWRKAEAFELSRVVADYEETLAAVAG